MTLKPNEQVDALVQLTAALISRSGYDQPTVPPDLRRSATVNEAWALMNLIAGKVAQSESEQP
jgi:hypothetical protein